MFSCNNNPESPATPVLQKTAKAAAVKEAKYFPPIIKMLTPQTMPAIIAAGTPIPWPDSLNNGAPVFTNFGAAQGLPSSQINCVFADREGNIWMGTQGSGAIRYDGKKFVTFGLDRGLSNLTISSFFEDKAGNIWIATIGGGVACYDGKKITILDISSGLPANIVSSITQDAAGNMWFGTIMGAARFDGKKIIIYTRRTGLPGVAVQCLFTDASGNLWIGTNHGVAVFNRTGFKVYTKAQGLPGDDAESIIQDHQGNIWLGGQAGLSKYNGQHFTNYSVATGMADNGVNAIAEDAAGAIWVGTSRGLSRFDGKKFTTYQKAQGLPDNVIQGLAKDNAGKIWLATSVGGASRYEGDALVSYTLPRGKAGSYGCKIFQDRSGKIWFGTSDGGVSCYNGKVFTSYTTRQGLAGNTVTTIMQDKKENLWFGTDNGVSCFNGKTFVNYTNKQGLPPAMVYDIIQDKNGNMWFATWGGGVVKFDGKAFTNYTTAQGLAFNIVVSILQDKAGNIWFGTGDGTSKFDGTKFTTYQTAQGLAGNIVSKIIQGRDGYIWFATGRGLTRFDGMRFTTPDISGWQKEVDFNCVEEDIKRNRLWFGTTAGLSWWQPAITGKATRTMYGIYDYSTGYPVEYGAAVLVDTAGIVWAACGNNRIIRLKESLITRNYKPLSLNIEVIKINGQPVCWNYLMPAPESAMPDNPTLVNEMINSFGKKLSKPALDSMPSTFSGIRFDSLSRGFPVPVNLVLPNKDRNVEFKFLAVTAEGADFVKYQYKLEGYDKTWSVAGNNTAAVFGNIPEGNYTFKLKALSPDGVWSYTEYKFKVLPPWFRSWWAWLVYIVLAIAGIWTLVYYRSWQLVKQKRELEHTVQLRTGEVMQQKEEIESQRDNLETAFAELKNAQAQLVQSEKMASLGEVAAGIAHEIQNPLNFVNNFSDLNKELIAELEDELMAGQVEEALAIAAGLKQNEEKINHHGKRAGSIIKNMLQHSRLNTLKKQPASINKLADEFINIAYEAMIAGNTSFKVEINKELEAGLPPVNVVVQDIGRVMLNLFNNAFYAVYQKMRTSASDYIPKVNVTTYSDENYVTIMVTDNGTGISQANLNKIMQPFFTTKPTGEGTGLGLSIAYDTVVKVHSGKIDVKSIEGVITEFIVSLPLN